MEWARDNAVLGQNENELSRLFIFEPRESLAIKITQGNGFEMQIWSLQTDSDWIEWIRTECSEDYSNPGLALILAKRPGEKPTGATPSKEMTYTEWLKTVEYDSTEDQHRFHQTFGPLSEKGVTKDNKQSMRQGARRVPFSSNTFKSICERFHVHDSIAKAIDRQDTPSFFSEEVEMGTDAQVYNCRTPREWRNDMALSLTHFPETTTSFAILYGCTNSIERSMLDMLSKVNIEICHPMLLPGIFAELELARHDFLVRTSIFNVLNKICELETAPAGTIQGSKASGLDAWQDLAYLQNKLITWNGQIAKMILNATDSDRFIEIGAKIASRLSAIHEEYEEMIRDCKMRLDAMALAAQWSERCLQGDNER
ncbi:hypothetical protein IQ07DRAFT_640871 [Pyrenochaeta sp. DS3sAY3a]|nr:hypothetical protein IQ07DRAFT_640871 [Pyrenochaeta sp. DS3sAY3a]